MSHNGKPVNSGEVQDALGGPSFSAGLICSEASARGFTFMPDWILMTGACGQVVPAAKEITHLPIAVDPSHATFWRPWVGPMTLASVACGSDSIMLEVHPDPENSAVDPLQPIDFESFNTLMEDMERTATAINRSVRDV